MKSKLLNSENLMMNKLGKIRVQNNTKVSFNISIK